ncbi:MAG: arginine deiminase family protein [Candidatus Thermoplasmatota archaeon]
MRARRALVREPGSGFSRCISTHPMRHTIDVGRARAQHAMYVSTLESLGLEVIRIDRDDSLPDSCFVEDTAIVHGEKALVGRPAKEARRRETGAVMSVLSRHLSVRSAEEPATVEGGDVLHLEGRLVCGLSKRTNAEGARQLSDWLEVRVDTVEDPSVMHLKSHVSHIDGDRVLVTRAFARHPALDGLDRLVVPDGEEYAANLLSVDGTVVMPKGYPATEALLRRHGVEVVALEMTEFPKCDGAMTCLSVLF